MTVSTITADQPRPLASVEPITVTLPAPFDPRWSRIDGITVEGNTITIDPTEYFFRFEVNSWLLCDWAGVRGTLLPPAETADIALEQSVLDYIKQHGTSTTDAGLVLQTAWQVYSYLFRNELLPVHGLEHVGSAHLRMLREASTLMALNKVELDGHISNVGPCWFFPAATSVVFDLDLDEGGLLDEVYHGTWFTEHRRVEAVAAHAALGGRLVHGCQSVPNQSGGVCMPYGAPLDVFRQELTTFRDEWLARVHANRVQP